MLAPPSAFLASVASTLELQQSILPEGIKDMADQSVVSVEKTWASLSGTAVPTSEARYIQKAWDRLVAVSSSRRRPTTWIKPGCSLQLPYILVTGYKLHPCITYRTVKLYAH